MRMNHAFLLSLALVACGPSQDSATPANDDTTAPPTTDTATASTTATAAVTDPAELKKQQEAKKKEEDAKKLADDFAKLQKDTAAEKTRFDDKLKKEVADLSNKNFPSFKAALEAAMKANYRTPGAKDRDASRHPVEMLTFFGLKQDSRVLELDAGGGWYTEMLAPVLKKKGKLAVSGPDPSGPATERSTYYGQRLRAVLDKAPELGDKVDYIVVADAKKGYTFAPALHGTFDVVLAFRNLHGWNNRNLLDKNLAEVFTVLKPGGVFAVEAHRAKEGADPKVSSEKGYLPQSFVIQRAEAAGFKLDAKSELNANPKDTADHPEGVWSLPPTLRGGDKDKDKYVAIGESDRMTLKFVKPKTAAKPAKP